MSYKIFLCGDSMNGNKIVNFILNFLCAFFISLMSIILAIKFTIAFKTIYYISIKPLNILSLTSLNESEIKKSYNYIVTFLLGKAEDFSIPSFSSSNLGKSHFYDVRALLYKTDILFYLLYAIILIIIIIFADYIHIIFVKYLSVTLFSFTICLTIPFMIDFNSCFTLFHKLLFNNDNWLFSPDSDPIINILPQNFFLICGFFIFFLLLNLTFISYKIYKKTCLVNYKFNSLLTF